jgi:hypothetical protein
LTILLADATLRRERQIIIMIRPINVSHPEYSEEFQNFYPVLCINLFYFYYLNNITSCQDRFSLPVVAKCVVDRPSEADTVSGVEPTATPTPSPTPTPFCGCQEIIVNTTGDSSLEDPRRSGNGNVVKAPLGIDPDFLSFNFEVAASLKERSDPELCNEGQLAKRA